MFFGKNFIPPKEYIDLIPPAPQNVLSCINFLQKEDNDCGFAKELPEDEVEKFSADFSDKSSSCSYEKYMKYLTKRGSNSPFFRNISFYRIGEVLVQQYMKSSYFQECDLAIENGKYAYLFGDGFDRKIGGSNENFISLITTQICYDVGYARKKENPGQEKHPALVHVIQSNTKEISDYVLPDDGQPYIPGHPAMIIHSDPEHPEVFLSYPVNTCILPNFDWSTRFRYAFQVPKESFTFVIDKGKRKDSYIITHWVVNTSVSQDSLKK